MVGWVFGHIGELWQNDWMYQDATWVDRGWGPLKIVSSVPFFDFCSHRAKTTKDI